MLWAKVKHNRCASMQSHQDTQWLEFSVEIFYCQRSIFSSVYLNFNFCCYKSTCLTMFALWTLFSDHIHWGVTLFCAAENHVFGPGWDSITHSSHCETWWSPRRALALKMEIGIKSFWHTAVQCFILHHGLQTLVTFKGIPGNRMCHSWLHTKQRDLNCYDSWFVEQRWLSNGQSTCSQGWLCSSTVNDVVDGSIANVILQFCRFSRWFSSIVENILYCW